ncbi:MAG: flagellar biosynthesis protein FlhB [Nitrospirae bacterium 13_2_20CM_2_61_4]|nr:MAG: flagellar biosynthesis protein FlhB [Nitrospirae bacterium 13_2_20CM_2_61_4]
MSEQAGERTEQATTRRREDARRKGQVASSREVSIATSLTATVAAGSFMGVYAIGLLTTTMQRWLAAAGTTSLTESTLPTLAMHVGRDILAVVIPFGLLLVGLAVGAHILQTGWVWSTERLQWDLTRLSPMAGLKRLLSLRALMELPKSLFKIGIVTGLVYWNLKDEILALPLMLQMEPQAVLFQAGRLAWSLTLWIAGALGVLAVGDYAFQRWQFGRDLRMTREEVKREQRETEGDPLIRSRIRTLQRERARRRMMQEVPKADVVITNPTHLAVALKYDGIRMAAPTVVAKGAGYIAERIRQVAAEHGVPIIENKPLARSLHKLVDLGREIPSELYQAVAEILALGLRSKGRL